MSAQQTTKAGSEFHQTTGITMDNSGKYRWVVELPMLKSLHLLLEVWKVLGLAVVVTALIGLLVSLLSGGGAAGVLGTLKTVALVAGILLVLSIPAYLIVTRANNGAYTVLFEMDDSGIDHIQIKTEAAKAPEHARPSPRGVEAVDGVMSQVCM